jgi:hypothetical protein
MERRKALEILGLDKTLCDLTSNIVLEAFRIRVKLAHPDTAESRGESNLTHYTVQELTMAKKTLLESLPGTDLYCRLCRGRGMVPSHMGFRKCVACGGTGERK